MDILKEPFAHEQKRVEKRLFEIMDAARNRNPDLCDTYHAFGPKFTKFDDFEPLDRQDAETTAKSEREALTGVKEFDPHVDQLKVDVFGQAAVATFIFNYNVVTNDGDKMELKARATLVFAQDSQKEWRIVHEHFSPFKGQP